MFIPGDLQFYGAVPVPMVGTQPPPLSTKPNLAILKKTFILLTW
jgi:hypothetical protein